MEQKYSKIQQEDFEEFFRDKEKEKNDKGIEIPLNSVVDNAKRRNNPNDPNSAQYSPIFSKNPTTNSLLANVPSITVNQSREIRSVLVEPKVDYIRNSFKGFPKEMYQEFLGLYAEFFEVQMRSGKKDIPIKAEQNKKSNIILYLFEKENETYFLAMNPSKFCSKVRNIIMEFEEEMEYQEPRIRKNRWRDCHEELFCLKYFCSNAARIRNDIYLSHFINEIKDLSETVIDLNYNKLRNKLKELVDLRRRGNCDPIFDNMDVDRALIVKREQLERANNELEIENQLIKNDSDALKEAATRDLEKKLKENFREEINALRTELQTEIHARQNSNGCRIL